MPTAPDPSAPGAPEVDMRVVTLLGDSITAGFGLPSRDALPVRLEEALSDLGTNVRVRSAGVSGDTSASGLARVDFSVQDDTDLCVVALGGNDLLQGIEPAAMRSNLAALLDRLANRKIPVLLAGMRAPPSYGRYAEEFDAVFVDLARSRRLDFYPFLLEGVALDSRLNQADGIHPNARGVEIIALGLAPVVIEALGRSAPP
ncbi:arylesterase [Brevundimonas variabilis]